MYLATVKLGLKRLGPDDHLVRWQQIRPRRTPVWLDAKVELPSTVGVREVTFQVRQPGFRTHESNKVNDICIFGALRSRHF